MKILMILANPFTNDPRVYNEAKSLIKAGHNVTVLAWDKNKENHSKEVKDGINIVRSYNTKFMNMLPYDIFRLHFWWNKGYKDALKLYKEKPFDIVHCHDQSSLPIGLKLKRKLNLPLIYDAHEIWGYMVSKHVPWWRYYLLKEKRLLRHVDHMIITNDVRKKIYEKKTDGDITVIDNYKHIITSKYIKPLNHGKKQLAILYIGALLETRFLLELVEVVGGLQGVTLNIGGKSGEIRSQIKEKSALHNNVNFLGTVPEIMPLTLENDVVFIMISTKDKNDITASTNKQYEAMVCGRPIICTKGTFVGDLTEKEDVGISIEEEKNSLRDAIMKLRDNHELREKLGRKALKAASREYNWEKQEENLVKVYEEITR